jgi:hypothetical protein
MQFGSANLVRAALVVASFAVAGRSPTVAAPELMRVWSRKLRSVAGVLESFGGKETDEGR